MRHHGVGQVGAADRLALRPPAVDLGLVELVAELAQGVGHRLGPALAILAPRGEARAQLAVVVVDQVPEDVQVLPLAVDRRDLDGRPTRSPSPVAASAARWTPSTVVVAQGKQLDSGLHARRRHHVGG